MEARKMLDACNAPDVPLECIVADLPDRRLLKFLRDNGITTIGSLKKIPDTELLQIPGLWTKKLKKLKNLIETWEKAGFPVKGYVAPSKPETVLNELQQEIFGEYKNLSMIAMRNEISYESIGAKYGQSRQSVQDAERRILGKFIKWYEKHRLNERIGDMYDFVLYCDTNFPEDQIEMKNAVRRLANLAQKKTAQ